ncbi:MAG: PrsW family intramembrane metalloprotease [Spirochaetaceae bacterium]|nr:PrsW family intramembrane metalloprotease [Spirochaetaceae bacterium]MDT8299061.1 PrsW family intramembrane metalloprotease [Spirochaetaceae bacterium]
MISFFGIIIILASVLPPIIFIGVADRFDHYKKEPRKVLLRLFAAGVVMPLAALVLELVLVPLSRMIPGGLAIPAEAFLGIALPEEGVKLTALFLIIRRRKEFDEVLDGAVYGIAVAMGFALLENILYVMGSGTPMAAALLRGITAIPLHAAAGGFMGLALARDRIDSKGSIGLALLVAVLIHGIYDLILLHPLLPDMLIFPVLIAGWWLLINRMKRARKDDFNAGRHYRPKGG